MLWGMSRELILGIESSCDETAAVAYCPGQARFNGAGMVEASESQ